MGQWEDTAHPFPQKHYGSTCLLHNWLLITPREERPLLVPRLPGTATQGAGRPIKSSVGLVVPPHPFLLLGSSSWSVHIIPAALVAETYFDTSLFFPSTPELCLLSAMGVPLWPPAAPGREEAGQESSVNNCSNLNINRKKYNQIKN